jgi:carbon storage regulator
LLILTRKVGETVLIGENSRRMVVQIRGKQIGLGIEAPLELMVLRTEDKPDSEKKPTVPSM